MVYALEHKEGTYANLQYAIYRTQKNRTNVINNNRSCRWR